MGPPSRLVSGSPVLAAQRKRPTMTASTGAGGTITGVIGTTMRTETIGAGVITVSGAIGTTMKAARIATIGAGATTGTGESAGNAGGTVITGMNSSRPGR